MAVNFSSLLQVDRWLEPLLPRDCVVCGGADGSGPVCGGCREDLPAAGHACPRCAAACEHAAAGPCEACRRRPPPWHAAHIPYRYSWPLDDLVAATKFARRLALAAALGELLADALPPLGADLVVPVPLHPWRLAQRGFNQAAELAEVLARRRGLALSVEALHRLRPTPPQSALPARARRANVRDAFGASRRLARLEVVLVDDVVTTGSTAAAATRACLRAGARRVTLVALARA